MYLSWNKPYLFESRIPFTSGHMVISRIPKKERKKGFQLNEVTMLFHPLELSYICRKTTLELDGIVFFFKLYIKLCFYVFLHI